MFLDKDEYSIDEKFKILKESSSINTDSILSEDYYGKLPSLIRIESLFKTLSNRIQGNTINTTFTAKKIGIDMDFVTDLNGSKELDEIETIVSQMFGFEKTNITIIGSSTMGNAMTIPFYYSLNQVNFDTETSKNGIRFKNPKDKVLNIFLFEYNFTSFSSAQNTAILLHEIGHNFFLVNIYYRKLFVLIFTLKNIYDKLKELIELNPKDYPKELNTKITDLILSFGNLFPGIMSKLISIVSKLPIVYQISKILSIIEYVFEFLIRLFSWNRVRDAAEVFLKSIDALLLMIEFCMYGVIFKIFEATIMRDYANEKYADSFATSYGYGKEVAEIFSTGDIKFTKAAKDISQIPIFSFLDKYASLLISVVFHFKDPHPSGMARCKIAKQKLEYELENNSKYMTKSQISTIKNDIKSIDEIIENAEKQSPVVTQIFNGVDTVKDKLNTIGMNDKQIFETSVKLADAYLKYKG
jgi:hypothetical protein